MTVRAEEMAKAVRVAIDMNRGDAPLIMEGDTDTLSLDDIIYSKLADAVRLVETEAPLSMLESGHDFGDSPLFWTDDGDIGRTGRASLPDGSNEEGAAEAGSLRSMWKGFIILPEDFMRLVSFRMSDWRRTVFEAMTENDPRYALQSSRFGGICGNPEKPVAAIVRRSEGKVLEFYSCRDNTASVAQATYVPTPRIDRDGGIDVAEECYRAAVYRAGALALASVGDQLSATMLEISKSLLQ